MASQPQIITILPPNAPMVDDRGFCRAEWYRFFVQTKTVTDTVTAGSITTAPGSGLQGGGLVTDGLSLSIANNGVSNAMLRDSLGCSVIGRAFNSVGDPQDVVANGNNRVLSREGDQLAFRTFINGVTIGPTTAAPLVRADAFETTQTPAATATASTHSIPIVCNGVTYYMRLSATP